MVLCRYTNDTARLDSGSLQGATSVVWKWEVERKTFGLVGREGWCLCINI